MVAFKAFTIIFFAFAFLAMFQEVVSFISITSLRAVIVNQIPLIQVSVPIPTHGVVEVTTPKVVHPATHGHGQVNVHETHHHPHDGEDPTTKCCSNMDLDGHGKCRNCGRQQ